METTRVYVQHVHVHVVIIPKLAAMKLTWPLLVHCTCDQQEYLTKLGINWRELIEGH